MIYLYRRNRLLGRRLYVAPPPTGSDSNAGTRTAPYATIRKASEQATPGTTVYVAPGTYAPVAMNSAPVQSGTAGNPIRFVSTVRWGALISSAGAQAPWIVGDQGTFHPDNLRIQGFAMTAPDSHYGILVDANNVWVLDCHIYNINNNSDVAGAGISLEGFFFGGYVGTGNAAIGNWVHHIGRSTNSLCHPIYPACSNSYIANNVCFDSGGYGIHCYHGPTGTTVVNNTVWDCIQGGIVFGEGPEVHTASGYVGNNIVRNCPKGLHEVGALTVGAVDYRNNCLYQNTTNADLVGGGDITGTVTTDPGMVNFQMNGSGDYQLAVSSTIKASGLLTNAPSEDFYHVGRLRPPSIGAFRAVDSSGVLPSSSALPTKVAGAYWPQWETVYPAAIDDGINTLLLSFAITSPGGDGSVFWDGMYGGLNQLSFQASVQAARSAGRCCIVSVGGAGITFLLDSTAKVNNFVSSIQSLYNAWGGFDGLDWDVENQVTPTPYYVAASQALKDLYGANFAISCSYAGNSDEPSNPTTYKAISQQLEASGDLDMSTIQYYDYNNPQTSDVVSRLNEMVNTWGISPFHLGVGVKYVPGDASAWQTTGGMVSMWNAVEATYPTLRGINNWETIADRDNGYGYANVVALAVTT